MFILQTFIHILLFYLIIVVPNYQIMERKYPVFVNDVLYVEFRSFKFSRLFVKEFRVCGETAEKMGKWGCGEQGEIVGFYWEYCNELPCQMLHSEWYNIHEDLVYLVWLCINMRRRRLNGVIAVVVSFHTIYYYNIFIIAF